MAIVGVMVVWLPFLLQLPDFWGFSFSQGMIPVWQNYDGPNYLIVARTWYDKLLIAEWFSNPLPLEYYPAHWPFYPAVISIFDQFLSGPWAMLAGSVSGLAFFYFVLYRFLIKFGLSEDRAFGLSLISLVIPARWIAVRSVGSPEAWFIAFILLSLMAYKDRKFLLAGVFGAFAQLTKSPGILLFLSYGLYELILLWRKDSSLLKSMGRMFQVSLIPLTVLMVFSIYYFRTGDFWAYFNSGDNFHLFWPPFSIFSKGGAWVGDFWLEDIIWVWLFYGLGLVGLLRERKSLLASFMLLFFTTTLFVSHRDISRYILPLMPLALVGLNRLWDIKELRIALLIIAFPALLFTWNFILNNTAPIADWTPYL